MTSLWLHDFQPSARPPLPPGLRFDIVVVGGGLTGLVTALLLSEYGASVAVVEADRLGSGTTGNTTGKISLLQGVRASRILKRHNEQTLRAYLEANRDGQRWLLRYCAEHDIPVQREPAYTYAQTEQALPLLHAELDATRRAGLDTEFVTDLDVPFPLHGAVRLDDQAQLDIIDVVAALTRDLDARGVPIFEGTRVRGMRTAGTVRLLETTHGDLAAATVILATGTPIFDRGGFFARLTAQRSYAAAFTAPQPIPRGMYLSADSPTRSIRYAPMDTLRGTATPAPDGSLSPAGPLGSATPSGESPTRPFDPTAASGERLTTPLGPSEQPGESRTAPGDPAVTGDLLIVGGNGHEVGRVSHPRKHADELIEWTRQMFPGAEPILRWSAQDYYPIGEMPYAGPLLPRQEQVLVATGYAKWGLATAVAAAHTLVGRIVGKSPEYADAFDTWNVRDLSAPLAAVRTNAPVALHLSTGWLGLGISNAVRRSGPPAQGRGRVELRRLEPTAVCTVDGHTCAVSAICPHLGGILRWNDAEKTWDCPLHGSRFAHDGRLLEGPATRSLAARSNSAPNPGPGDRTEGGVVRSDPVDADPDMVLRHPREGGDR
ncbi:FAD-dependent oxidoreductase [Nocardia sp. 2]|uniref:FAD-dependent oxidoreductase n=1 Tax=Nocardia acididurans TaxID=2802282 RepID=A0ABS1M0E9_9NOCA|nr:FAD-dependent oxidoreductase [Nocardia acididurans]MBL1074137.1 FAD-dependent oxidoreductase [Nocardia acididurans]